MLKNRFPIFFLVVLFLSFIGFKVLQSYQGRLWRYPGRFNLVDRKSYRILSYPDDRTDFLSLELDPELYIDMSGYGLQKIKNISSLALVEKKDQSELLAKSLSLALALPIDGIADEITFWDRLKIWWEKHNLPPSRIKELSLKDLSVSSEVGQSDGSTKLVLDVAKTKLYFGSWFLEKRFREEDLAVSIANAAGQAGLATQTARILENSGVRVVEITNAGEEKIQGCQLRGEAAELASFTAARIAKILNCQPAVGEIDSRLDLLVILGV